MQTLHKTNSDAGIGWSVGRSGSECVANDSFESHFCSPSNGMDPLCMRCARARYGYIAVVFLLSLLSAVCFRFGAGV